MPSPNNLRTKVNKLIEGYKQRGGMPRYALTTPQTHEALREAEMILTYPDQPGKEYLNHEQPSEEKIELIVVNREKENSKLAEMTEGMSFPLIFSKKQEPNKKSLVCDLALDYTEIDESLLQ